MCQPEPYTKPLAFKEMNFAVTLWEVPGGAVMDWVFTTPVLGWPLLNRPLSRSGLIYWLLARILHSLPWLGPKFLKLLSVSGSLEGCVVVVVFPEMFLLFCQLPSFWMLLTHRGCPWQWVDQRGLENQWLLIPPRRRWGVFLFQQFRSSFLMLASANQMQQEGCSAILEPRF